MLTEEQFGIWKEKIQPSMRPQRPGGGQGVKPFSERLILLAGFNRHGLHRFELVAAHKIHASQNPLKLGL